MLCVLIKRAFCVVSMLTLLTCQPLVIGQEVVEPSDSLVIVISGFASDASPEQIDRKSVRGRGNSGMYQLAGDLTSAGLRTEFFNWNGTRAGKFTHKDAPGASGIVSFIRGMNDQGRLKHLVVVGHSWGGHTMLEVAEKLGSDPQIHISLAIGVDPSSLSRGKRPKDLPSSIDACVIYHTRNAFVWGAWENCDRVENIDLGDSANGFKALNGRDYAAKLDIAAHNAAEWDEAIQKDIVRRIKGVVSSPSIAPLTKSEE